MARRRIPVTASQRTEIWRRWRAGQTLTEIGELLEKPPGAIHQLLAPHGGVSPVTHRRSTRSLSMAEREEISRALAFGKSLRQIAAQIGRSPSTVSREVLRHGGRKKYRATIADASAWKRAKRPKLCKLALYDKLRDTVAAKLVENWSPQQISAWLKMEFPMNPEMQVSHEAIYLSLFIQARGALKKELVKHLRSHRVIRRGKSHGKSAEKRGRIPDAVTIRERPPEVEDRAIPGHWEGDLISGSRNTHIATLVERHSRFVMLVKLSGKSTASVVAALAEQVKALPKELRLSLTWDRGYEMTSHKLFTLATEMQVYFCDPRSPWQRGSNENTNGLLRQYFPKGSLLSGYSQEQLNEVARELNTRPRKTLGYHTPAYQLSKTVALTA